MATATPLRTTIASPDIPAWLEDEPRPHVTRPRRPQKARRWTTVHTWIAAVTWVELASAIQLVRFSGIPPWRSVWAEDGRFFLPEAIANPIGSLFKTHAGYYQLICRMMGTLASLVPIEWAGAVFAAGGAIVASVLSVYVFFASASVLRTTWARGLMAAATVLTPAAVFEVSASGVDLHWYFLFASFWALWSLTQTRRRLVVDALVVGIGALSSPLTVLLVPLVLRRIIRGTGWQRVIVPAVFGVGVAAQTLYHVTHPFASRITPLYAPDVPRFFALRIAGGTLVGDGFLKRVWLSLGSTLLIGAVVVVAAVVAYGLAVGKERRVFIVVALAYSVGLTVASLVLRGTGDRITVGQFSLGGSRYTFVPVLLLITVFIAVADIPTGRRWFRRLGVLPAVIVFAVLVANAGAAKSLRGDGPDWVAAVKQAQATCRTPQQVVNLPGAPHGWQTLVECRQLNRP